MVRRRVKEKKTLWTEYPEYSPMYNLDERPLFDESRVGDEHQVLGQIIRENWVLIHSLARDYMLSSAFEWRALLGELEKQKANLEISPKSFDDFDDELQKKIQSALINKEAEFEKAKTDITESFKETLQNKDLEISQLRMLVDSIKASSMDLPASESGLKEKEKRMQELEHSVQELRDKAKSQEIESMSVQMGISRNFQNQINDITSELYERQEQIDKLKKVLSKAKEQLIFLKDKNEELKNNYQQLEINNNQLEKMIEERDEKLKRVIKTIESLD